MQDLCQPGEPKVRQVCPWSSTGLTPEMYSAQRKSYSRDSCLRDPHFPSHNAEKNSDPPETCRKKMQIPLAPGLGFESKANVLGLLLSGP